MVRVEALLDLTLAANRGLHTGSQVFDNDRQLAADTAGDLAAPASGAPSPVPSSSGVQAGEFSAGVFGRAGVALGTGSPAAGRSPAGSPASAPVTPPAGTQYSFGAAVRARGGLGSGGSAASDVSSISGSSWHRTVSPVRARPPSAPPGARGRTTTGRGELDGDGGGVLPPRDTEAPTVHQELLDVKRQSAQALVASARAQADLARTSAAVNSAAVVKLAKDTVSHEYQLYESRRFVASTGGSNIGWDNAVASIGDEGCSGALN